MDDAFVRQVLEMADPNVLRLALHQLTGDPALAAMRVEKTLIWAGALYTFSLGSEHHGEVRNRAFDYLRNSMRSATVEALPSRERIRTTMELFGHGPLSDVEFGLAYEETALEEFPRDVHWNNKPSQEVLQGIHVVVIGAGISGIAAAVQLQRLGIPYTVIERQNDIGGTWNLNTYPEARVDSTSLIYQYKFEKKYPWTEFFASAGETRKYLRHCASKFNIADNIVFSTEVIQADWNEETAKWNLLLRTEGGNDRSMSAQFVISASGLFSTPKLPDIPGIETFRGKIFHTANWDPGIDLCGKRVAQIGTGATGVQVMPHLARNSKTLTVFQRTPNWVFSMEGYKAAIPNELHWLFEHFPFFWNWFSYGMYFLNAQLEGLQAFDPQWQKSGGAINQRNDELRASAEGFLRDKFAGRPDLIEKTLPRYPPMARRPTVDNGWYDALLQDNVELITEGIESISNEGIVDVSGRRHECDLIVCAAGFATLRYFWPVSYTGRDGACMDELWRKDGPRAYIGLTMPGFPNLFTFFGPNSQGRSGSFYTVAEMWARYSLQAITDVIESGKTSIECRFDAYENYNTRMDEATSKLLWETHGKGFYYLTEAGRSVVNSPWASPDYHALLLQPDYRDFVIR